MFSVDEIQNGDTHSRVKLIEFAPFCLNILSSKVWITFSLIFRLNIYIRVTYRESCPLTAQKIYQNDIVCFVFKGAKNLPARGRKIEEKKHYFGLI
jgi:hypothetical protein